MDRPVPIMDHYQEEITGNMIAEYQYMLNMPVSEMDSRYKLKGMLSLLKFAKEVETDNPDAEKFSAYTLRTMDENYMLEDILFYGIEPDSRVKASASETAGVICRMDVDIYWVEPRAAEKGME